MCLTGATNFQLANNSCLLDKGMLSCQYMRIKGIPNKKNRKVSIVCETCKKVFLVFPCRIDTRKNCSRKCSNNNPKKANTCKERSMGNDWGSLRKITEELRHKISASSKTAWADQSRRHTLSIKRRGINNPNWKQESTNYSTIHKWLVRSYGRAYRCEALNCKSRSLRFDWALLRGKRYIREKANFIQLCRSCHNSYDRAGGKNVREIFIHDLPTKQQ